jgi:hypothetical protein
LNDMNLKEELFRTASSVHFTILNGISGARRSESHLR